jgi:hypothetical protein
VETRRLPGERYRGPVRGRLLTVARNIVTNRIRVRTRSRNPPSRLPSNATTRRPWSSR